MPRREYQGDLAAVDRAVRVEVAKWCKAGLNPAVSRTAQISNSGKIQYRHVHAHAHITGARIPGVSTDWRCRSLCLAVLPPNVCQVYFDGPAFKMKAHTLSVSRPTAT